MHDGKFMAGKHQRIKWTMSHQLLRLHNSPKWALLWGNPYKAVQFAVPDVVLPHAKPCAGGPTQRDPYHPLRLQLSFLLSSLQCWSSRSAPLCWVNCLGGCAPNQICHSACFQNNGDRCLFSCFFKKSDYSPGLVWSSAIELAWLRGGNLYQARKESLNTPLLLKNLCPGKTPSC